MGEGAINPTERPGGSPYSGGSARAKGAGGAAHGVMLPCLWWGETFPGDTGEWVDGEMVEVPAQMPAHIGASTPSRGGREGIGTGVSRRPFLYYSYRRKGNNTIKPSTAQAGQFYRFFKQANDAMAAPPPPR